MKIVLELLDQSSSVRKITVRHDIVIGRGSDCNLRLSAPQVSRRHCFLRVGREGVSVTDLDSSNGTWVNGQRIASGTRKDLVDGNQISLGPVRFVVHVRPEAVSGAVLPGGLLNEVVTEQCSSPDATTFSGREGQPLAPVSEPRTSSVAALQAASEDAAEAADSCVEIIELGRQLSVDSSAEGAVILAPGRPGQGPRVDRIDSTRTAHDIDLRGAGSLDGVDVLDPAVLSGQFPPDRPMWSREAGRGFGDSEAPLPPTLQLNPDRQLASEGRVSGIADRAEQSPSSEDYEGFSEPDEAFVAGIPDSSSADGDNSTIVQAASSEDDDMGPELHAFLKGL